MISGKGFDELFSGLFITIIISVPLAVWKLIDILVWIYNHVNISIGVGL
jgi:hypothetical protein